jgi:iron-sulfur cluster insertion protein
MTEIKARPDPSRVSQRAARRIGEILAHEGQPGMRLRISVSGGGCSGFQYDFALDDQAEEGDIAIEQGGARVVVDGMSLMYLIGCELDYVEDLTGSYFRVSNPNATASCGCGNSFAI